MTDTRAAQLLAQYEPDFPGWRERSEVRAQLCRALRQVIQDPRQIARIVGTDKYKVLVAIGKDRGNP